MPPSVDTAQYARPNSPMDDARTAEQVERIFFELRKVIVGQTRLLERMLVGLLARGHCLLESVPGLAKTLAAETLANVVGGTFARIQFTPDLLPSDIVGTRIYRGSSERFDVELGPVFVNFLLTDEINRAPAKVQSALLEVMQEHQVTIGGITHPVPAPFFVVATQNPIESEGVYQLPDAQRDRFMMKIVLDHPTAAEELTIIDRMAVNPPHAGKVIDLDELIALQRKSDAVFVDRSVAQYAVDLVQATRNPARFGLGELDSSIGLGASPRASINLVRGARALSLIRGRTYATPQDVFDVAPEVLRHRLLLTYDALARDITPDHIVNRLLESVPPPGSRRSRTTRWLTMARSLAGRSRRPEQPLAAVGGQSVDDRVRSRTRSTDERARRAGRVAGGTAHRARPRAGPHARADDQPSPRRRAPRQPPGPHAGPRQRAGRSSRSTSRATTSGGSTGTSRRARCETHVREQIADRDLEAWLVVDTSAAMRFGTTTADKAQVALAAAAGVGFLTARNQNRLGAVLVAGPHLKVVPPRFGRDQVRAVLSAIATSPPCEGAGPADLAAADRPRRRRLPAPWLRRRRSPTSPAMPGSIRWPGSGCATTCWRSRSTTRASSTSRRSG